MKVLDLMASTKHLINKKANVIKNWYRIRTVVMCSFTSISAESQKNKRRIVGL